jgi:hypothetical protein
VAAEAEHFTPSEGQARGDHRRWSGGSSAGVNAGDGGSGGTGNADTNKSRRRNIANTYTIDAGAEEAAPTLRPVAARARPHPHCGMRPEHDHSDSQAESGGGCPGRVPSQAFRVPLTDPTVAGRNTFSDNNTLCTYRDNWVLLQLQGKHCVGSVKLSSEAKI